MRPNAVRHSAVALACVAAAAVQAQPQVVRPPQAQAWIDVATFTGMGMPMGGGGNPMAALGSLLGGGAGAKNTFGNTQTMSAGRWVDVTLYSRTNPALAEAEQAVPGGFQPSALKLQAPRDVRSPPPEPSDDKVVEHEHERPRGKLLLYWGCGPTIRAGQPKVLDMASATAADLGRFFQSRRATQRGAHSATGRPLWPSPADARMVPASASLVGPHAFSAQGVPANFRFQIPAAQDLMPALAVRQAATADGATDLSWDALPTARGYFIAGMGASAKEEMVIWTSSEQPDTGFGLTDYQTNPAVDRWLGEKILLSASTTRCTVPKGVFPKDGGGMLRMIAYGSELNLVHPPRPQDPKVPWEQEWAVKVRVKSVASLMLGMPDSGMPATSDSAPTGEGSKPAPKKEESLIPKPADMLRGILGR